MFENLYARIVGYNAQFLDGPGLDPLLARAVLGRVVENRNQRLIELFK